MSYESRATVITALGIQGVGSLANPVRPDFDNLPGTLPGFINGVVVTSSISPAAQDGAVISPTLFVQQFETPWNGVAGNGITIIPGGTNNHSPTILARISTDAGNAATIGGDGGVYTPSFCTSLQALPTVGVIPPNGLIPFYDPGIGTCRAIPASAFGGGGGGITYENCNGVQLPNGTPLVTCADFPTEACDWASNLTISAPLIGSFVVGSNGPNDCRLFPYPVVPPVTVVDTPSIDLTASGLLNHTIQADIRLSIAAGNQLIVNPDGLFVPALDTTTLCSVLAMFPVNNTPTLPILIPWTDTLGNCWLSSNILLQTPLTVVDTASVNLTASGIINHTIQADVSISATVGNQIVINPDGLFVPAGAATVSTSGPLVGDGSVGNPVDINFTLLSAQDRCDLGANIPAGTVTRVVGKDVAGCLVDDTLTNILAALPVGARGVLQSEGVPSNSTPANTYLGQDGQWHLLPNLCFAFNFPDVNFGVGAGNFRAMFTRQTTQCPITTNEVFVNDNLFGIANNMEFGPGGGIRGTQNGIGPSQVPPGGSNRILSATASGIGVDWIDPNVALCRGILATPIQPPSAADTFVLTDGTNCYRSNLGPILCTLIAGTTPNVPDSTNLVLFTDGVACFVASIADIVCEALRDATVQPTAGPVAGVIVYDTTDNTCKRLEADPTCTTTEIVTQALGVNINQLLTFGQIVPKPRILVAGGPNTYSPLQADIVLHTIGASGEIVQLVRPPGPCDPTVIKIKVAGNPGDQLIIQDNGGAQVDGAAQIVLQAGPTPFGGQLGEAVELVWVAAINQWIAL